MEPKIYESKSIPKHMCCPLCDGQKYNLEPGTHTLEVAGPENLEVTNKLYTIYGYNVVNIKEESDVAQLIYNRFLNGWISRRAILNIELTEEEAAKQTRGWLITIKERDEDRRNQEES